MVLLISHLLQKTSGISLAIAKLLFPSIASVSTVVISADSVMAYTETIQNHKISNSFQKLQKTGDLAANTFNFTLMMPNCGMKADALNWVKLLLTSGSTCDKNK